MDNTNHALARPFGIIGLIIGCFSLIFSVIPCIGYYAITPAILSLIFCVVAFVFAKKGNTSIAVPLSGIIISVVAVGAGVRQYYVFKELFEVKNKIENAVDSVLTEQFLDSLDQRLKKAAIEVDSTYKHETDSTKEW